MNKHLENNYLKEELYQLIKNDNSVFDFIQETTFDALGFLDTENPENQWLNSNFWKILGYQENEIPQELNSWKNIINQNNFKNILDTISSISINENIIFNNNHRFVHKNKSNIILHCTGKIFKTKELKSRILICYRKQTEKALQESEEKFRILFEQAAVSVAQVDTNTGMFVRVNKKYTKMIGYSVDEMLKLNFQSISYPDDLQEDLDNMELLKKGEISEFSLEKRLIHKTGKLIWVSLSVSAMWKKGDAPDYHIAVVKDITKQKLNELQLKKLSVAVEQCPVTIAITDTNGIIEYVNPAFSNITGYGFKEAIGLNPRILNAGKTPTEIFQNMWQTISSGKTWNGEFINKKKNGELYYEEAVISPVFDEKNQIINYIAIKNDISQKKLHEEQIKNKNEQLTELNATKDKFFSIIAHDLKNPFNSILGFSELLVINLHKYNQDKILQFAKTINKSATNAFELLENLLEWASSQTGKIKFKPELIVIENLFIEIIKTVESNCIAKNITIDYEINECISIVADKNMLNTILRNLITNAIKYTNKNGLIKISAEYSNGNVLISVKDNGIGMDNNIVEKLFRINEKISTPGTENEHGTGLGLILCKEFVEKHDGKIWVESEIGNGSTFHFTLKTNNKV